MGKIHYTDRKQSFTGPTQLVNFGLDESDISVTDNILAGGNCNQYRVQATAGLFYIASIKTMKCCFPLCFCTDLITLTVLIHKVVVEFPPQKQES